MSFEGKSYEFRERGLVGERDPHYLTIKVPSHRAWTILKQWLRDFERGKAPETVYLFGELKELDGEGMPVAHDPSTRPGKAQEPSFWVDEMPVTEFGDVADPSTQPQTPDGSGGNPALKAGPQTLDEGKA